MNDALYSVSAVLDRLRYTKVVLEGEKPADLPVMRPTKFELIINLRTTNSFDLTIPPRLTSTRRVTFG
jgi:ABC-type uncharacterized transport system substrate-binding protein